MKKLVWFFLGVVFLAASVSAPAYAQTNANQVGSPTSASAPMTNAELATQIEQLSRVVKAKDVQTQLRLKSLEADSTDIKKQDPNGKVRDLATQMKALTTQTTVFEARVDKSVAQDQAAVDSFGNKLFVTQVGYGIGFLFLLVPLAYLVHVRFVDWKRERYIRQTIESMPDVAFEKVVIILDKETEIEQLEKARKKNGRSSFPFTGIVPGNVSLNPIVANCSVDFDHMDFEYPSVWVENKVSWVPDLQSHVIRNNAKNKSQYSTAPLPGNVTEIGQSHQTEEVAVAS